jgi:hypothetical protein
MPEEEQTTYDQNVANALNYVKTVLKITGNSQDAQLTILLKASNAQIQKMT